RAPPAHGAARRRRGGAAGREAPGGRCDGPYRGGAARASAGSRTMRTRIVGGRVIDPANGRDAVGDVWISDGRIIDAPPAGTVADATYDAAGKMVMAGAIDVHSHIAGWNVNTARLLLPEFHRAAAARPAQTPLSNAGWSTYATGRPYAQLAFPTGVEPAVLPHYALHAHLELADIPIIDKATLAVLGNDDFLLGLMRDRTGAAAIRDYVAWTLDATRSLGIKVVNAGGSIALKENVRQVSFHHLLPHH